MVSRVGLWLIAPLGTLALLLVLYNNLNQGRLILLVLLIVNGCVSFVPFGRPAMGQILPDLKFGSACSAAVLAALLILEVLFPSVMPGQYAQIRDLAKGLKSASRDDLRVFRVVYDNGADPAVRPAAFSGDEAASNRAWNVPGEQGEYYGYDPNGKFSYLNIVRWNSRGYFDNDYSQEKPPGTYRIVFVGDSYVESCQVPLRQTFHKVLERLFNEGSARGDQARPRIQVIALGHSGTGQKHHLELLRNQAMLYDPDMVAVMLCGNDFCDDSPELTRERTLATGAVTPQLRELGRHGLLAMAFALRKFNEWQMNRVRVSPEILQWSAAEVPRVEAAWNETLDAVRASKDYCRSRGVDFVLIYVGSEFELQYELNPGGALASLRHIPGIETDFAWDVRRTVRRLRDFCATQDIRFISLLDPLVEASKKTGKLVFGDHYTMFGHEVAAKALKERLPVPARGSSETTASRDR